MKNSVIVCALAAVLLGGLVSAHAGVVSYVKLNPLTADADSGIGPANFYTHLLDFGTSPAATVNGVPFTQVTAANIDAIPGFSYTVNTSGRNQHGGNANTGVGVGQGISDLLWDMFYNGNNAPGGVATITLSGLVPGFDYETRIYNRQWGFSDSRTARFDFDTDGLPGAEDTVVSINQDDASGVPPSDGTYAGNTAYAMAYAFTAQSNTMTVAITQGNLNYSWHVYGVTNEEFGVKDPLTWDGLGDGNFNSSTQWTGGAAGAIPDLHTDATVVNNTVTVTGQPGLARSLTVNSNGGIDIAAGQSLNVAMATNVASGSSLSLGAGATFSTGSGSIDALTGNGDATIGATSGTLSADSMSNAAPGVLAKQGGGTFRAAAAEVIGFANELVLDGGTVDVLGEQAQTTNTMRWERFEGGNSEANLAGIDDGVINGQNGGLFSIEPDSFGAWTTATDDVGTGDNYAFMWYGTFHVPTTGTWGFQMEADDWEIFWLDTDGNGEFGAGENIMTNLPSGPDPWNTPNSTTVSLTQGQEVAFAMAYYEIGGGEWGRWRITPPGGVQGFANPSDPAQDGWWSGLAAQAIDATTLDVTVTNDSTLSASTDYDAAFGKLTLKNGVFTTEGAPGGISFRSGPKDGDTIIHPDATAVGFDPRVPTDYGTISNDSTQAEVTISKNGPGTWRLDGPLSGTTDNILWRVEGGTFIVRGPNTLSARPITVAGGTLDVIGETSLGGVDVELAGGRLYVEGTPGNPAPAPPGAIAHYPLDSATAGITSNAGSAGSVLDGVLMGDAAVTTGGSGRIGEAMQFNGAGYVEVLYDAVSLGNLNTFSVSAWVNIDVEPGVDNPQGILGTRISTDGTATGGDTFDVKVWQDMIHGDVGMGAGWISTAVDIRATDIGSTGQGGDVAPGEWHLVSYVIDDALKQFQLYLDGDLKRTMDYSAGQIPLFMGPDQKLWIGDDYVGREEMIGRIDEVFIYDRALDGGEVDTLWGNGFGPNDGTAGLDMSNTDLLVTADSTVYAAQAGVGGVPAPFGQLTLQAGVLNTGGSPAGISFAGTTIPADATAVGFNTQTPTDPGVIDANGATVTISKLGPGDLVLDKVNVNLDNATFDAQEGRLIGLTVRWPLPTADPFGNAAVQLSGGEVVLASGLDPAGVSYLNLMTVTADSTLTAGTGGVGEPGVAIAVGDAGTAVTLADATTLSLGSTDGCTLDVAGALSGPAAGVSVSQGDVVSSGGATLQSLSASGGAMSISGGASLGSVMVTDGVLNTAVADVTVDILNVRGAGHISTDAIGVTVNDGGEMHLGGTDFVAAGSSFNVTGLIDENAAETLTLGGGMVTVSAQPAGAAGLSYVLITNDADSGIDPAKVYTHAIDPGASGTAVVNGVAFDADFPAGTGSENIPNRHGGNLATAVTGDIAMVFQDMDYNANPGEIILSGLTDGQLYDFRIYNRSWGEGFDRSQQFDYDVGNDGSIEESVVLNPDVPTADPPGFTGAAWNVGYAQSYVYTAGPSGELKLSIAVLGGGTFHLYGLTNEELLAPPAQATLNNLAGTGTVSGDVIIEGTISPGSSAGMVTFQDGDVELGEDAVYQCEIAEWDSPGGLPPVPPLPNPPMDPTINDRIHSANRDMYLDGELVLTAISKLHPRVPHPDPPNVEVEWYGDQTRVIASSVGEAVVRYVFATVPDPQPQDWSNILTGTAEWSQGHIGRGVFLTRQNEGGEDDAPGISYTLNATKLHLFQACDGDTNGDRTLGGRDIQNIQSFALFGIQEDPGPGFTWPPDWPQGDFDGDGLVTGLDISAILATGLWPTDGYAAIEPGEPLDGVVDLLLYPEDVTLEDGSVVPAGTVMIDPDGLTLNGYVLRSADGIFTGAPAQQLNWFFVEDTDRQISGNMGAQLSAVQDLGPVVGPEWTIINPFEKQDVNPFDDLTLTYTVVGTPGTFVGNLIIVPEPSTIVMLLASAAGWLLLLLRRRRRKSTA